MSKKYNLEQIARETGGPDYLKMMYAYTFQASKYIKPEQIGKVMREQIGGKAGDIAMTVADELIQQGLEKGLEEGLHSREIAFSMFSKNYDLDEVADIQKLSCKQVSSLRPNGTVTNPDLIYRRISRRRQGASGLRYSSLVRDWLACNVYRNLVKSP